jgi:hypothetical protein
MRSCIAVLALLTGCAEVTVKEANFIRPDSVTGAKTELRFEQAALRTALPGASMSDEVVALADGATAHGVLVRQPGARTTVLYFGGNAFHLDRHAAQMVPAIGSCGVNVAVFDYRGYGRSGGNPTVELMGTDALAVFDHVNGDQSDGLGLGKRAVVCATIREDKRNAAARARGQRIGGIGLPRPRPGARWRARPDHSGRARAPGFRRDAWRAKRDAGGARRRA